MSRYDNWEPDSIEDMLAAARWRAQVESVLRGKRGRAQIADMAVALLAMPDRRLITGHIVDDQAGVCFVGAYAVAERCRANGTSWEHEAQALRAAYIPDDAEGEDDWEGSDSRETEALGEGAGLALQVAAEAAWLNDMAWDHLTPEDRWQAALAWCWYKLAFPRKYRKPQRRAQRRTPIA